MDDPRHLRDSQYAATGNLQARIDLHRRFTVGGADWFPWVFDRLPGLEAGRVLDVGCGTGELWRRCRDRVPAGWRILLGDLSEGMVRAGLSALEGRPGVVGAELDAGRLPLPDGAFDLVVANHMLYHLPDIPAGIAEAHRVLRPGGTLVATTNGLANMGELRELVEAVDPESPYLADASPPEKRFGLESGRPLLEGAFGTVELTVLESALEVTEADAVLAYLASWVTPAGPSLREEFVPAYRELLEARIAAEGCFRISKQVGAFTACREA